VSTRIPLSLLIALAAALALPAGASAVAPAGVDFGASWLFSPGLQRPVVNQDVTFTGTVTTWGGTTETGTISWSFGDGASGGGATATHPFGAPGAYDVTMTATNDMAESTTLTKTINVNGIPAAGFSFGPTSAVPGQEVKFASESDDPDGITTYAWDFGDGVTSSLRNPSHPFATTGPHTVTLTVTDAFGATATATQTVSVFPPPPSANKPPVAGFAYSPSKPKVGQQVELVSSAVDPDGRITDERWDLDGDGQFDDARGDDVLYTFPASGPKPVRLRVEDNSGAVAVKERTIDVALGQAARAGFLNPFPVVRITGEVRGSGTRIRLISVRAPIGTLASVKCTGRACPAKLRRHKIGKSHLARFKTYERTLRAGIRLEVFVRKAGTIGKYTRFTIRSGASPRRLDRCLMPGKSKPVRCPS
jgi:PKD repeat protein